MSNYLSILVITTLKLNAEGDMLELDLPFKVYGQNIIMLGEDITYRLDDLSNDGAEVLAKVDYRIAPHPSGNAKHKDDTLVADGFAGNLGYLYSQLKGNNKYKKHVLATKEDTWGTYDQDGNYIPYTGTDKKERIQFCKWDRDKEDEDDQGEDEQ